MSNNVWVVLKGEKYDDGIYHGHYVAGVYSENKTLEDVAKLHVTDKYLKDEGCWECDDYIWVNAFNECIIIEKHKVDT